MKNTIAERVEYMRTRNGIDLYTFEGFAEDVIIARFAFPGGRYTAYTHQELVSLASDCLPGGTKKRSNTATVRAFELLGAQLSCAIGDRYTYLTLSVRKDSFLKACTLLVDTLKHLEITEKEENDARARLYSHLVHAREDTSFLAQDMLVRTLFARGHPHWGPDIDEQLRSLKNVRPHDVDMYLKTLFPTVGALVCVVGDIASLNLTAKLPALLEQLVLKRPDEVKLHPERTVSNPQRDTILTVNEKDNVDLSFGIPILITESHDAMEALRFGVSLLGGSSTSRLFTSLRTKQSLTYGAYAGLSGLEGGYPGFVSGYAIFPKEVFKRGREVLKTTINDYFEKGLHEKEFREKKDEVCGKFAVSNSTTMQLSGTLFKLLLNGKNPAYFDTYCERVSALTRHEVHQTLRTHVRADILITVAAGGIDSTGVSL